MTATWPGADGADIRVNNVVVQPATPTRLTDYTVPFGAFGGLGAMGFTLTAANFTSDAAVIAQLGAAGRYSFSPILATGPIETLTCASSGTQTCTTSTTAPFDTSLLAIRTSGSAANIYVNLQGRETGGTVPPATYVSLVPQIAAALRGATDPNPVFNGTLHRQRIFTTVESRPLNCREGLGLCTSRSIGQNFGDVLVLLAEGYNFDGLQSPPVARQGDGPFNSATTVFSVPNFYGSHGHESESDSMSATFLAAGPDFQERRTVNRVHNIDVAPTIQHILGVRPEGMDGRVLHEVLRR